MKQALLLIGLLAFSFSSYAQVGIGTTTPQAFLNVAPGRTVLFGGDTTSNGNKLIWYASKGAFRAGGSNAWNSENVGISSFAAGTSTQASAFGSFAMGDQAVASGVVANAFGSGVTASGTASFAVGASTTTSGFASVAMGYTNTATGQGSVALGYRVNATADYSVAFGQRASTNGFTGAFVMADQSTTSLILNSTAANQMTMRFAGGYRLFTNNTSSVGLQIIAGGNAWQTLSDSTIKENFRSADGDSFLKKISNMRLGSWNYKGQDSKQYRHYGPMAQDFYAAFGKDELGTIGEEKSINQADFDGVNLIAIKALIEEVNQLKAENSKLRSQASTLEEDNSSLQKETASLKSDIDWIKKQLGGLAQK